MPRIGLLSDSHGRAPTTQRGVAVLLEHGAQILLHLGDVGSVEVIDALYTPLPGQSQPVEAHLVFGNTDWDQNSLASYARHLGIHVDHPAGRMQLEEGDLIFCHGHEQQIMAEAIAQNVKYLCHGHTHRASDTRKAGTRIINPGALFRAQEYTVAVLDTAADEVVFYPVPDH